MTSST